MSRCLFCISLVNSTRKISPFHSYFSEDYENDRTISQLLLASRRTSKWRRQHPSPTPPRLSKKLLHLFKACVASVRGMLAIQRMQADVQGVTPRLIGVHPFIDVYSCLASIFAPKLHCTPDGRKITKIFTQKTYTSRVTENGCLQLKWSNKPKHQNAFLAILNFWTWHRYHWRMRMCFRKGTKNLQAKPDRRKTQEAWLRKSSKSQTSAPPHGFGINISRTMVADDGLVRNKDNKISRALARFSITPVETGGEISKRTSIVQRTAWN